MKKEAGIGKKYVDILIFCLAGQEYGFPISCVREVMNVVEIHSLPNAPFFIDGVIDVRGHIIAVMDLKKKLRLDAGTRPSESKIILSRIRTFIVGLVVDEVVEVAQLESQEIRPLTEVVAFHSEAIPLLGIAKINERIISVLDLEKALTDEESARLLQVR